MNGNQPPDFGLALMLELGVRAKRAEYTVDEQTKRIAELEAQVAALTPKPPAEETRG